MACEAAILLQGRDWSCGAGVVEALLALIWCQRVASALRSVGRPSVCRDRAGEEQVCILLARCDGRV